ncbi:MAG: FtsH protease activity modulator HflK [Paracoccaceae bacterium]
MAGSGGPWGGGGGGGGPQDDDKPSEARGPRRPQGPGGVPEIDEIMRKGQEQLRVLMGGRGTGGGQGGGRGPGAQMPAFTGRGLLLGAAAALFWGYMSFYTVKPEEKSVELFLGEFSAIGDPGLNFAPWPLVTVDILPVTREQVTDVGAGEGSEFGNGLMLTRDQNIVNIEFQVVWNISSPEAYLFNLADPQGTIKAVSESAMRDIIARSELAPILNRDRGRIAADLRTQVQATLDSYNSGINVVRVNFAKADPPREVIDAFRAVQAAQQERDRLEKEADAYANKATAGARGQAAQLTEEAEAYRASVINQAEGEAARFLSVYAEYVKAPDVTRKRLYLETMERVLAGMNKVILDGTAGGEGNSGVVPILPLNELGVTSRDGLIGGGNN